MGLAVLCRNMRFRRRSVRTRDGYSHTMSYTIDPTTPSVPPFDMTGVEALDVLVNNPGQIVIASDSNGDLLQETPTGSGVMSPLAVPIPLPAGISMQTAKAYNRIYMAFSNLLSALSPPMVLDGPTDVVTPVSQNPIGGIWTPGRNYLVGDVVRTSQNANRWFRCIVAGLAGNTEPTWPILDGYLVNEPLSQAILGTYVTGYGGGTISCGAAVASSVGFNTGDSITIFGCTPTAYNGSWIITGVGTGRVFFNIPGSSPPLQGTGGTITDTSSTYPASVSAQVTDPNGTSQWVEWTPGAVQFVPPPEPPTLLTSILGQAGAPSGTIPSGVNVYVCLAYQNANGESAWTQPIVYKNASGVSSTIVSAACTTIVIGGVSYPGLTEVTVTSATGFTVGASIVVAGVSNPIFNGTFTIVKIIGNSVYYSDPAWVSGATGTGGTLTQTGANNNVLELFFQNQYEVPGPTAAVGYGAAGYGGPRVPQWLISVLGLSDPDISWPTLNCLNVYVASVTSGGDVPTSYYQYASGAPMDAPVVITSIPSSGTLFVPRTLPTASLTKLPFIGSGGPRYLAVERLDLNDSLVPIDPGSPLLFTFLSSIAGSGQANITFIQRATNGVVTCIVNQLAGFSQGSQVIIAGVTDTSFNGSFTLTGVSPNQYGGATLLWTQGGSLAAAASTGGTATSANAASAFITPQDLILTISRTSDVVSAVVNALNGLAVGAEISVAGVADSSYNGTFTILTIAPNLGGGGTVTWSQTAADGTSTGGVMTPTGASVGTNTAQGIAFLARNEYPASPGTVIAIVFNAQGTPAPPPPGFSVGAQIVVSGVGDASFNGTFTITKANPNPGKGGGYSIYWTQSGASAKYPANGTVLGSITLLSGATLTQAQGNLTAAARSSNVVTATIDNIANFVLGGEVQVTGVTDATYDGTFTITGINVGASQLQWSQVGPNSTSSGGEVEQTSGGTQQPTPVAILPPGGPFIAQDIAAWSVEGGTQAGPFTFIPEQDPITPFTAQILSIGNIDGAVTALLSSTSGLQAGNTIQISGSPNGWFDGVFVLAQVAGNTIEFAGVGPGTGYAGGTVSLIPTLPTSAMGQNNPVRVVMTRNAAGLVSALVDDVSNLNPGMRIQISGSPDPTLNGYFVVLSVSQNQLPGSTTPLTGTATWQSSTLAASITNTSGSLVGLPGIILNAIDNDLANADDVTSQLNTIGAPNCVNVYFSPSLNMMVYTIGQDSSHYFSNPGDAANIANPGGILGVNESNGERTRGFVETISGELISLKEKSGYEITVGSSTPNEYGVSRRWFGHGPCGPRAWDTANDFVVYFDEDSGLYRYHQGIAMQVGQEKQGTWDRLNKSAAAQVCVAIDNVRKEIHIALPLDGATVPNHDLVLNYFNGWNDPLMLTMTGELMPDPHGRRWSDNDIATSGGKARLIKVIQRHLSSPPSPIIVHRQVVFCLSGVAQAEGATGYIDMSVPEQMNDNGAAIAPQYQPAFAQSPNLETLVWDKLKARALGLGNLSPLCIQPVTEDPESDLAPVTLDLSDGLPDSRTLGMSEEVNELFSITYSNEDPDTGVPIPGAGFELHRSVRYGKVRSAGTPEDQGSN